MNVVFLDIDGVLTSKANPSVLEEVIELDLSKNENLVKLQMASIDMSKIALVREITEQTESKVVVISSWKTLNIFPDIKAEFINLGIPVIDKTVDLKNRRGAEIKAFLDNNDVKRFVILDDSYYDDYDQFLHNLIKIDSQFGLDLRQKELAIKILKSTND